MDRVLVDLPFVVRETVLLRRRRTPETIHRIATVPVRIRILGDGEGETFRIGMPSSMDTHPANAVTGVVVGGECFVDAFDATDGRYGVPMGDPTFFGRWSEALAADPGAGHGVPGLLTVLDAVHPEASDLARIRKVSAPDGLGVRVLESDEAEASARAVRNAERVVLHGGRLASSMVEPVVRISSSDRFSSYASRMATTGAHVEIGSLGEVHAMDTAVGLPGEEVVGVPDGFREWRYPDVEIAIARTWRRLERASVDFSWGTMREEAASMRSFEAEILSGRVGPGRLREAAGIADDMVRVVARRYGRGEEAVVDAVRMAERVGTMMEAREARSSVPSPTA